VFFFLTYVAFGMYYFFNAAGLLEWHDFDPLPTIPQSKNGSILARFLRWYFDISTNIPGEILFISAIFGLIVVPQFLSFVISGLSGCGKLPSLVSKVTKISVLMLVKFCCGLAAFEMSAGLFRRYIQYLHSVSPSADDYYGLITIPLFFLALSFSLAAGYYRLGRLLGLLMQKGSTGTLNRMLNHMTRFTNRQIEPESQAQQAAQALQDVTAALTLARDHKKPDLAAVLDSLGITLADLQRAGADTHDLKPLQKPA
jgi:hypothetical protein